MMQASKLIKEKFLISNSMSGDSVNGIIVTIGVDEEEDFD